MDVQEWLGHVPAVSVYVVVGLVIGLESLGIPLPGELVLVGAALLASQQGDVNPVVLGVCASAGAVIGDSIGYAIGRKGGRPLLAWLGRRFPRHFSAGHIATAERSFDRWGMWAVFFGRFVALLRIFAGPLAGVLRMPYWKFFLANMLGGVIWAGGTTAVIYYVGVVAESWLKRFSWLGLVFAVLIGLGSLLLVRRKAQKAERDARAATQAEDALAGHGGGETASAAPGEDSGRTAGAAPGPSGAASGRE